MKLVNVFIFLFLIFKESSAQRFSIAPDKMNVFYVDIDNPLTIAVENYSAKLIVVKTDNGIISGKGNNYIYHSAKIGRADIILYIKVKGKLKEIGRSSFRVKSIPYPVAKVGPSAGGRILGLILKSQQYIRADYNEVDMDVEIDSFTVNIIPSDTCYFKQIKNYTNKFSQELNDGLKGIKKDYVVIFREIAAKNYKGEPIELDPIYFIIRD